MLDTKPIESSLSLMGKKEDCKKKKEWKKTKGLEKTRGVRVAEEGGRRRGEERRGGREEGEGVTEKTYNCTTLECHSPKPRCQSCVRS